MSETSIELEKWWAEYKPIINQFTDPDDGIYHFETYGDEIAYLNSSEVDIHNVWTWCDGDKGTYLVSGYRFVNRIGYFVTEIPWTIHGLVIPYDTYEEATV